MEAHLRDFRLELARMLERQQTLSGSGAIAAKRIANLLPADTEINTDIGAENPLDSEVQKLLLDPLMKVAPSGPLLTAFGTIANELPWYHRKSQGDSVFDGGHANAEIIGPKGVQVRSDVLVGVTVMGPNLTYPDHHHPPEEVYVVMSDGLWRQNDEPWWTPGPGGYVYNPPNILHAMKSLNTPLCAIWSLLPDPVTGQWGLGN